MSFIPTDEELGLAKNASPEERMAALVAAKAKLFITQPDTVCRFGTKKNKGVTSDEK